jgi:hypothetical protein
VPLAAARQQSDHHTDERNRRDEQARERARDAQLGVGEEHPRDPHLDDRVRDDPPPPPQDRADLDAGEGNRDEQHSPEGEADEHEVDRAEAFE